MARAAGGMMRRRIEADLVLTSPMLRARQTGSILARGLGLPSHCIEILDELACGAEWSTLHEALRPYAHVRSLILVGHQPDLSALAAALLGTPGDPIDFGPGSLARFDVDRIPPRAPARLVWLLSLEQLERAGLA
jgi:phosphohistidine phosphatase